MPDDAFKPDSKDLADSLQRLYNSLQTFENPDLIFDSSFADYIFFPISHLLRKQSLGDRTTEYVLRILNFLILNAWATGLEPELAKQLLILITMLVGGPPTAHTNFSDKLRLNETGAAGCEAINSLFLVICGLPNLMNIFSKGPDFLPSLGHTITVLLDCAVLGEGNLDLQINSLDALTTAALKLFNDGDVLASLTPGIVSSITKILAQRDCKRHYSVLVKSLDLFGITLSKVFNDQDLSLHKKTDEIPAEVKAFRTRSWLSGSRSQVKIALNTIVSMRSHSKTEVIAALLRISLDLLSTSLYALENCISILIDNVVFVASLENTVSTTLVETAFFQFGVILSNNEFVRESLKERIYEWIESLPRLMTAHDESQAVLILSVITTSMKILSTFLPEHADIDYFQGLIVKTLQDSLILRSSTKLLPAILPQASELSAIATSTDLVPLNSSQVGLFNDLGLDLVNRHVEVKLKELLIFTGLVTKTVSGFESLMIQVQEPRSVSTKALIAWMAVNTFEGMIQTQGPSEIDDWLITDDSNGSGQLSKTQKDDAVLDMYSFCGDIFAQASSSLNIVKGNERYDDAILCSALQGMESIARYMGEDFKSELMDVLYPLVDFLGSPNATVRKFAQKTIISVAQSCHYPDLRTLLVENSDYIIDALSIKLNTLDFSLQGPVNLTTLIKLSGITLIPYLDDIIGSLFVILDNYHGYSTITSGIFQVLESVVNETNKGYQTLLLENNNPQDPLTIEARFSHTNAFDDLLKSLSVKAQAPDFHEKKGVSQDDDFVAHDGKPFVSPFSKNDPGKDGDSDDDDDFMNFDEHNTDPTKTMDNEQEDELKKWASPIPKSSYQLIQKIVEYSDRFLTHESSALRKLLLELIARSLPILASSQTDFLPIVNVVWPLVVIQLDDSELFIVESALKLVGMLCEHSRDFMTTRVTQVWRKLKSLLPRRPKEFLMKNYQAFSTEKRMLDAVLACLAVVVRTTRIETKVFFEILESVGPFLSQHKDLVDSLSTVNADAVWLELIKSNGKFIKAPLLDHAKYPQFLQFVI